MGKYKGYNYKNDSMFIWLISKFILNSFSSNISFFLYRVLIFYIKFIFVLIIKFFYLLDLCFCFNG